MTEPQADAAAQLPAELASIQLGMADTPGGQRLAISLTMLLDPGQAKELSAKIADLASSMSKSGLVIAAPSVRM